MHARTRTPRLTNRPTTLPVSEKKSLSSVFSRAGVARGGSDGVTVTVRSEPVMVSTMVMGVGVQVEVSRVVGTVDSSSDVVTAGSVLEAAESVVDGGSYGTLSASVYRRASNGPAFPLAAEGTNGDGRSARKGRRAYRRVRRRRVRARRGRRRGRKGKG